MNKLTLEKIATSLLKACKDEGVTYKEAAKIFNTEPAYFKMLEREDKREAIPEKVMDRFHAWVYSGKKLKEYKMPESPDLPTSDPDIIPSPGEIVIGPFNSVAELTKAVNEHEKKARSKREPKAKFVYPHEKPKRKYTRKPKETTTEFTSLDFSNIQIIPVAKAAPDVRPDVTDIQREESETDLLKSEIKTLSFLLAREHEANEVLRAENGYLNLLVKYKERMIGVLESNAKSSSIMINDMSQRVVKLKYRGFWARIFNRPVK